MKTTYHMAMSVEGAIRNRAFKGFTDDKGNPMTEAQAETELFNLLKSGIELIPLSPDCEGFDPIKGCPGHPVPEDAE